MQNSPARHLWTGTDCGGHLWPETASRAAYSGFKRRHAVDGYGPR
jgi:hypothetical protein